MANVLDLDGENIPEEEPRDTELNKDYNEGRTTCHIELSPSQVTAYDEIMNWHISDLTPYITLGGYAGTGKTTILAEIRKNIDAEYVHFAAYTGKAALNMKQKLIAGDALEDTDACTTLHKMLYIPIIDPDDGSITGWDLNPLFVRYTETAPSLIVVDEASMVPPNIFLDLLKLNIPILFVGDHGQLPPFSKPTLEESNNEKVRAHTSMGIFNLMHNPDIKLEEIHRQALDSPIIKLSMMARQGIYIEEGVYSNKVMKIKTVEQVEHLLEDFNEDTLMLTDMNRKRVRLNRLALKFNNLNTEIPTPGTRVVCLKNNTHRSPAVFNGQTGTVIEIGEETAWHYNSCIIQLDNEEKEFKGKISKFTFHNEKGTIPKEVPIAAIGDRFDFGYCLTVHKAQGSEAKRVFLFGTGFGDQKSKWLYTAITRAQEELYICGDKI